MQASRDSGARVVVERYDEDEHSLSAIVDDELGLDEETFVQISVGLKEQFARDFDKVRRQRIKAILGFRQPIGLQMESVRLWTLTGQTAFISFSMFTEN